MSTLPPKTGYEPDRTDDDAKMWPMAQRIESLEKIKDPVKRIVAVDEALVAVTYQRDSLTALRQDTALELSQAGYSTGEIAALLGAAEARLHPAGSPISSTRVRAMIAQARKRAGMPPGRAGRRPNIEESSKARPRSQK